MPGFKVKGSRRKATIHYLDMKVALVLSVITHILSPFAILAVAILIMLILGMDISSLLTPAEPKKPDLEFILTPPHQPEEKPLDPNTRFRADTNSQAGGEHDPTKPIVAEQPVQQSKATTPNTPPAAKPAQPVVEPPKQQQPEKNEVSQAPPKKEVRQQPYSEIPKRMHPVIATPVAKAINAPPLPMASNEPVVKSSQVASNAASRPPIPVMDNGGPAGLQSAVASHSAASDGSMANPSPGNKRKPFGVDAIKEPDFGPYMKDLQRRIKESWTPPRGNESKRVVVLFRVDRQGELQQVKVSKSSGSDIADQAAITAIQNIFPFRPLPEEYAEENIDIEFTFDYNVFGEKQRLGNG